jgi:hypothetical protein
MTIIKNIIKNMSGLKTEDTGKMFEMAVCLAFNTPYIGKYKYDLELPKQLEPRLKSLSSLFPKCVHSAERGSRYDFTAVDDPLQHLSAKTIKKGSGKVAPQVIGQAQPQKFCEIIGIPYTDVSGLKKYIQENITNILPYLITYTFDCPNLYYHKERDIIMYIKLIKDINWEERDYIWTKVADKWNNSSTLKIKTPSGFISLVEFQFHTNNRTNMAIRWCYDNLIDVFKDNFSIVRL